MTVEIAKVKEAKFYIEADLEWLNRQISDERAQGFREWVDNLDHGVPKHLAVDIAAYKDKFQGYFAGLETIRAKLQAEIDGVQTTIDATTITVTEEVQKYLPQEETKETELTK